MIFPNMKILLFSINGKKIGGGGVALKNMPNLSWFDHFGLCYSL